MHTIREKLLVSGEDSVVFPFKRKLLPHSAKAHFIDHERHHHPGCNPVVKDHVCAEVIALPGGAHAVRVMWRVSHVREIEWEVIEHTY